uniref:Uncharacterized protein n=1 Tax=Oryza barthii TaxID=65489 RepID=A0A0D3GFI9_9ORYZ
MAAAVAWCARPVRYLHEEFQHWIMHYNIKLRKVLLTTDVLRAQVLGPLLGCTMGSLMGEYCSNAPCKWLLDLGKGAAHDTNTHNLFDGMPSQSEMPKENQRISKPVPINSTMNKKEKWLDKALDRILEKFEQMEAMRMQEEKIN